MPTAEGARGFLQGRRAGPTERLGWGCVSSRPAPPDPVDSPGLTIPADVLLAARMTEADLRQEIAVTLFQQGRLTTGQASRLAGVGRLRFQHLLASRGIEPHYGVEDFEADLETLRDLGRL